MMRKRRVGCVLASLLLTASFLVTFVVHAAAQDCTKDQLFQDFTAGWSQDMPRLLSTVTDDVVYEDATLGVVNHGKEELRAFAQGFFNAFPDLHFTMTSCFVSGKLAATEWIGTGTHKGDMPGMPATNKVASIRGVSVIELQDGKIKHDTDYWDMATMMRQLGFLPGPAK